MAFKWQVRFVNLNSFKQNTKTHNIETHNIETHITKTQNHKTNHQNTNYWTERFLRLTFLKTRSYTTLCDHFGTDQSNYNKQNKPLTKDSLWVVDYITANCLWRIDHINQMLTLSVITLSCFRCFYHLLHYTFLYCFGSISTFISKILISWIFCQIFSPKICKWFGVLCFGNVKWNLTICVTQKNKR
jgi:hypothetical protein